MAARPKGEIVPLMTRRGFRAMEEIEEVPVNLPSPSASGGPVAAPAAAGVDLSGKPKVIFLIGPGRSGKTVLGRYLGEMAAKLSRQVLLVALDPQNRSLATYFSGVDQPPTNDAAAVVRWLEQLLRELMTERASAVIDLGGGDTALGRLLNDIPDLVSVLEGAGIAVVAHYLVGPRLDDLASLGTFEAQGFRPAATSIICNAGLSDPTLDREEAFARVRRHSAFRGAVDRGAVALWMPRLDAGVVSEIEAKRLGFMQAAEGRSPEGRTVAPLGPFDGSRIRRWLAEMETEMAPISTWSP